MRPKLVVYGPPHPVTRAAFAHVREILDASTSSPLDCELVTTGRGTAPPADARAIYLRTEVTDALELLSLLRAEGSPDLGRACALVRRLDGLWSSLPTLSIQAAVHDDAYVVRTLAEHLSLTADQPMQEAARRSRPLFAGQARGFDHPLHYIRAVDLAEAERDLSYDLDTPYPTTFDGAGSSALAGGWAGRRAGASGAGRTGPA